MLLIIFITNRGSSLFQTLPTLSVLKHNNFMRQAFRGIFWIIEILTTNGFQGAGWHTATILATKCWQGMTTLTWPTFRFVCVQSYKLLHTQLIDIGKSSECINSRNFETRQILGIFLEKRISNNFSFFSNKLVFISENK
jgi:hypothetical protein